MSNQVKIDYSHDQSLENHEHLFEELEGLAEKLKNLEFNDKENQVILRGIFLYSFSVMENEINECLKHYYKNNPLTFSELIPFFQIEHLKNIEPQLKKVIKDNDKDKESCEIKKKEILDKENYNFFNEGIQFRHIEYHLAQLGIEDKTIEISKTTEMKITNVIDDVRKKRNNYAHNTLEKEEGYKGNLNTKELKDNIYRMKCIYIIVYNIVSCNN